jgi:dTDP-glucose 4,6-dehydratase
MKQKLMITGTAGFILGNFVRKAIYEKAPYDLVSIDRVSQSSLLNNIYQGKSHTFYLADICDEHIINRIFEYEKPDIVLHGAASTFVDEALKDPNIYVKNNVLGTQVIVNACVKWGVKKLIYTSTDEVMGSLKSENDTPWKEDAPLNPRNPYAASKGGGEFIVKAAANSFGLPYIITRSSNNYGRLQREKLIPTIIKSILNNTKIPVYGNGLFLREWTYVDDNCDALLKILASDKLNETYNISSNQEFTNIEVVQAVCNAMEKGHELITHIEDPRGKGHDIRYAIDCTKIKTELGWSAKTKFKDGIAQTVRWYTNNSFFLK